MGGSKSEATQPKKAGGSAWKPFLTVPRRKASKHISMYRRQHSEEDRQRRLLRTLVRATRAQRRMDRRRAPRERREAVRTPDGRVEYITPRQEYELVMQQEAEQRRRLAGNRERILAARQRQEERAAEGRGGYQRAGEEYLAPPQEYAAGPEAAQAPVEDPNSYSNGNPNVRYVLGPDGQPEELVYEPEQRLAAQEQPYEERNAPPADDERPYDARPIGERPYELRNARDLYGAGHEVHVRRGRSAPASDDIFAPPAEVAQ